MAQRPSEKPDWIPDDTTGITAPNAAKRAAGWLLEKPPFQYFNWFWNLLSQWADFFGGQAQEWIVIDSDADEQDYATLAAYIADAPASGDKVLVKEDQTITAQMVWPSGITVKFLDGARLLCATDIATSVLQIGSNIIIEGTLEIVLSHTGTTAKAVEVNGDNVTGRINVENSSTGTLTTAYHINASKTGNDIKGFLRNTGGGAVTNPWVDSSTELSNLLLIFNELDNTIRTNGAGLVDLYNAQTIPGVKTFTGSRVEINNNDATLALRETDGNVDNKLWDILLQGEIFKIRAVNDAYTSAGEVLTISRTGIAINTVNFLSTNLQHNGVKVPTISSADIFSNKGFNDSNCSFVDNADNTKEFTIECSGITTGTKRTMTVPDKDLAPDYAETTPTLTGIANVASSGATLIQCQRQGNIVTGVLFADVTPTAAATATQFRLVIPFASNFAVANNALGAGGVSAVGATTLVVATCDADPTNDELRVTFYSINTASHNIKVPFSYKII